MATAKQTKPLSTNSFIVKITAGTTTVNKFFTKCSSIEQTNNTSPYSDGETNIIYELPTSIKYSDLTLSKPLKEDDDTLIATLLSANDKPDSFISVDIQPCYRNGFSVTTIGGSISAQYCIVKSVKFPEIDTGGEDVAMLEVTLAPGYVTSAGSKQFWKATTATNTTQV